MSGEQVWTIAVVCVAIYFLAKIARPRYPLRIVLADGQVVSHDGLAKARVKRVVEFLERDVHLNGRVTVCGIRDAQHEWRIHFQGRIDEGTAQQIRNFLKLNL